jgi:hypothetical protein
MDFEVYDTDDFAEFAAAQPEVWTHGKPGYALPHLDDSGMLIYCDKEGWQQITKRYNESRGINAPLSPVK